MPGVTRRGKRFRLQHALEEEMALPSAAPQSARSAWRSVRFWGVTLALLAVVLWLAPMVAAHTPLLNQILASTLADFPGAITAQSASLGWFSPITLTDVQLRDEQDELVARAEQIDGDVPLWRLLFSSQEPGKFRIVKPELRVVISGEESNLERLFQSWSQQPGALENPQVELELIDGVVAIDDALTERHWQLEDVGLQLTLPRNWAQPLNANLSATLPQPDGNARVQAKLELKRSIDKLERASYDGNVHLDCKGFPLAVAEPLLRRRWKRLQLDGRLTSEGTASFQANERGLNHFAVDGRVSTEQLRLAGPLAGRDEIRLDRFTAPCRANFDGQTLEVERLSVDCDVGQVQVAGPLRIALDEGKGAQFWQTLASQTYEMTGEVDVARLAALLPETIRIREGTEITAGRVSWQLSRRHEQGQDRWQGKLESSNLVGQSAGKRWTWQKPMQVTFAAHYDQSLVIDKLQCQSSFLQAEAAGKLDQLSGWATFDLNLLAAELGQFLDLRNVQLAGEGWTYVDWKRNSDGLFQADGELQIRELRLLAPGRRPWSEEHLLVLFSLVGKADKHRLKQVQKASFKLESKPDRLAAELQKPIESFSSSSVWPLQLKAEGNLESWLTRLTPWLGDLSPWDISGAGTIEGTAELSADQIVLADARGQFKPLKVAGPNLRIDEEQAETYLKGVISQTSRQAEFEALQLNCPTLRLDARKVSLLWPEQGPWRANLEARYSGDLARWQKSVTDPASPWLWQWSGAVQGNVRLSTADDSDQTVSLSMDAQIQDLAAVCPQREPWREKDLSLEGDVRYQRAKDTLLLDKFKAASASVNCSASGRLASLSEQRYVTINGQLDYEPQMLVALLRPYIGEHVEITAVREARPFALQGPLAALANGSEGQAPTDVLDTLYRQFTAETAIGWVGANVYGFRVGSGEAQGRLANGVVNVSPLNLIVSEGRLTAAPRIRLWPEPAQLELDRGPLLTKVRISPEMCDAALQYIAPVLAGVTQAQGHFSMALDGCRVPLDHPDRGELAGQLTVHSVEIGPGPLVRELAVLLQRPGAARLSKESVVPFRMVDGRVYHRDLELVFPDLTIRTYGSVGLDQSLAIMAEMPVPPKWIGNNPLGTAIKNQTVRLPIGGTLSQPKIDEKALAQASAEFVRTGARNLLLDGLNRQLDRLFGPQQQ